MQFDLKIKKKEQDKDPNLMELIFYLEETDGKHVNQGLQYSDACRRQ